MIFSLMPKRLISTYEENISRHLALLAFIKAIASFTRCLPDAVSVHRIQRLFVSTHHWRIAMTSLIRNKLFDRQLLILTAGLLLQAHSAFASDSTGDAQAQARALLDPPVSRVMSVDGFTATQANGHVAYRPDPQEQARALLLGKPEEGSVAQSAIARDGAQSISAQDRRAYTDPQELARRMILGPGAPTLAASAIYESQSHSGKAT
jgi:hypothetical protein